MFPLDFLTFHFQGLPGVDPIEAERGAFAKNVQIAGQLWAQVVTVLNELPWLLCQVEDARLSQQERDSLFAKLRGLPQCCRDPGIGAIVLEECGGDVRNLSGEARQIIQTLGKRLGGTNMGLERLLALFRSSGKHFFHLLLLP